MSREPHGATGIAVGGLLALAAAMGIGRFVYTPILPFMEASLGLTESEAGLIASANFLGYTLGALVASSTTLPGPRRTWFLAALAASALSTGAMGLTTSLTAFLVLRLIGGVASAVVMVFATALVLDRLAAANRSWLSAVHFAGVGSGITVSALLVAGLALAGHGWQTQWISSGAVSLLCLGLAAWLIPDRSEPAVASTPGPGAGPDRRLIAMVVAYGLFGFGYVITATFISTMVRMSPEIRSLEPVIWLIVGVTAVPSVAVWAWAGWRFGNDRIFAIACLVLAVGVAMSALSGSATAIVSSAALLGSTFMGLVAVGLVEARTRHRGDPRRILAVMTLAFGLGQMIGPSFAGFAYELSGSFRGPTLTAVAALIVAAVLARDPVRR